VSSLPCAASCPPPGEIRRAHHRRRGSGPRSGEELEKEGSGCRR
jgi:hypothetical protein